MWIQVQLLIGLHLLDWLSGMKEPQVFEALGLDEGKRVCSFARGGLTLPIVLRFAGRELTTGNSKIGCLDSSIKR